jgi:DNA-binding FrmR family transcriptional regulator
MSRREPDPEVLEDLMRRMRKIEGQARGIQRMLAEGRDCGEITHQLAAMRAALGRVAMAVIAAHLEECLAVARDGGERSQAVERVADLLARM